MLIFVTAKKNVPFVHVVYILMLDIALNDVVDEHTKVIMEQVPVLCCFALSVDRCDRNHLNLRISF